VPLNQGHCYRFQAGAGAAGRPLAAHLADSYRHSTIEEWRARCARGEVVLDGERAHGDERLRAGQRVTWTRPPWHEPDVPTAVTVLFEDADVLAVDKPAGLPSMPAGGFLMNTLLTQVQARWPDAHPLHRLGRFTSGVVLFARTPIARSRLAADWRAHRLRKVYRALVRGVPSWTTQEIDLPIGPVPHPTLGSVHAASAAGKPAQSTARVLQTRADAAVVEVEIATGRPHQIRIHLAAVGHPLVGEPLYDAGGQPRAVAPGLPGDGGYHLHAHRLVFTHPVHRTEMEIAAEDLDEVLTVWTTG
jgi:23S rRNA pseudouridine1911/1915/1917 synthase